jgi:hypothetical protein
MLANRVVVATGEGVVAGEVVDNDAEEIVIDQPLLEGGAERVVVHRSEIQGVKYQQAPAPQSRIPVKALVTVAVIVGAVILFTKWFVPGP